MARRSVLLTRKVGDEKGGKGKEQPPAVLVPGCCARTLHPPVFHLYGIKVCTTLQYTIAMGYVVTIDKIFFTSLKAGTKDP